MRYQCDYRLPLHVKYLSKQLKKITTQSWRIMEVCGGQTHSILRNGIDHMIPNSIDLIHGPGCPVCVTPEEKIDLAIEIAKSPKTVLCSYGDMLRVPGSKDSLLNAKAQGANVRVVYSPMEALDLARSISDHQIVFFAIGFETTAPANAMTVFQADQLGLSNFSVLTAQVRIVPAMKKLLDDQRGGIQGFLAAGHVCCITGLQSYMELVRDFHIPIVVTGFEPVDILLGLSACIRQLEEGRSELDNQYMRSVKIDGNQQAINLLAEVFTVTDMNWRGLGWVENGGYRLRDKYKYYDAELRFKNFPNSASPGSPPACQSSEILSGQMKPDQCPHFAQTCHPQNPLGAPMVSSEGACAAYFFYRDQKHKEGANERTLPNGKLLP